MNILTGSTVDKVILVFCQGIVASRKYAFTIYLYKVNGDHRLVIFNSTFLKIKIEKLNDTVTTLLVLQLHQSLVELVIIM